MKRFWLFGGPTHYAAGGLYDFRGSFESVEAATHSAMTEPMSFYGHSYGPVEWWHIFDSETGSVAAESEQRAYGADELLVIS